MAKPDKRKHGLTGTSENLSPIQQLILDYQRCFSTDAGEAVLKDLRARFQRRRSFVPDSNATAFHEGQRDVVRMIENLLEADITQADPQLMEAL